MFSIDVGGNEEDTVLLFFFFQAEDGIRVPSVTEVQTFALPFRLLTDIAALQFYRQVGAAGPPPEPNASVAAAAGHVEEAKPPARRFAGQPEDGPQTGRGSGRERG